MIFYKTNRPLKIQEYRNNKIEIDHKLNIQSNIFKFLMMIQMKKHKQVKLIKPNL